MKSNIDRLPPELQYYIAEFIPSTPDRFLPYLQEFKNVVTDWYNELIWENWNRNNPKTMRGRNRLIYCCRWSPTLTPKSPYYCRKMYYQIRIQSSDTSFLKHAFFNYAADKLHYNIVFRMSTGRFIRTALTDVDA